MSKWVVERTLYPSGKYLVYQVTFPNGKLYFGISRNSLEERRHSHYSYANYCAKKGKSLSIMQRALRKYPRDLVKWEVKAFGLCQEFAKILEIAFISLYDTYKDVGRAGYNSTPGGDCPPILEWTQEEREKRAKRLNKPPFYAVKVDTLEIVGQWNCIVQAAEDLEVDQSLIGRCLTGKTAAHKGYIFCRVEDAHKLPEIQSRAQTNRKRKFEVIDHSGKLVGIWDNTNQCARDLGLPTPREIRAVLNNPTTRHTYKKYKFRFI